MLKFPSMLTEIKDKHKEQLIKELFGVGAHFGYSKSRNHPTVRDFIFAYKNRGAIIDLEKTAESLVAVTEYMKTLGQNRQSVLLVGNKSEAKAAVRKIAKELNWPYVAERWIGGTLTNFKEIKKRIARLKELTDQGEKGELSVYTKKERLLIAKEMEKLERFFGSISQLEKMPAAMIVIDAEEEKIAVAEAQVCRVPVIAISNSDSNLSPIDYPIVANDGSAKTIAYLLSHLAEAYRQGLAIIPPTNEETSSKSENLANQA